MNIAGQEFQNIYKGILNLDSLGLEAGLKAVTDGQGFVSPLQLSTTQISMMSNVGINTLTPLGRLHAQGSGLTSSTYSLYTTNSSNIRTSSVDDAGNLYTLGYINSRYVNYNSGVVNSLFLGQYGADVYNTWVVTKSYNSVVSSDGYTTQYVYGSNSDLNLLGGPIQPTNGTELSAAQRWVISRRDVESGSNIGSNLLFLRRQDNGIGFDGNAVAYFQRSTGYVGIGVSRTSPSLSSRVTIQGDGINNIQEWRDGANTIVGTFADSGALTLSGYLSIGNPVEDGTGAVPSHKVRITIEGTDYYLLATQ